MRIDDVPYELTPPARVLPEGKQLAEEIVASGQAREELACESVGLIREWPQAGDEKSSYDSLLIARPVTAKAT